MQSERFSDLLSNREDRIQRSHRVLKDHRDIIATNRAHFSVGKFQQVPAIKNNFPACNPARRRYQTHDRKRSHRLATTAFAHQAKELATIEVKADVINRAHKAGTGSEMRSQVLNFEKVSHCL